jgi:hypothetical protein
MLKIALLSAFIVQAQPIPIPAQPPGVQPAPATMAAQPIAPPVAQDGPVATQAEPAQPPRPLPAAPAPAPVAVTQLSAPDAFSTAARDSGLPQTLWRGTSLATVRTVLPMLSTRPLSPAAQGLARRVLSTGAPGPTGAGLDPELSAGRAAALLALGDIKAATAILSRTSAIDRSAALSRAAADGALLAGDDTRACAVEGALTTGREDVYWLRLRAYCQVIAGQAEQAQLTFDLAQGQARDAIYGRLMTAKLAGAGNPGAASLRNPLDYALSRNLGLDLAAAKPTLAIMSAINAGEPPPAMVNETVSLADPAILLAAAESADPKTRPRAEALALLSAALADSLNPDMRAKVAQLATPEGKAPAGRNLALADAVAAKLMGETAMLVLWTCADAGATGPSLGDRVRMVRSLRMVGLADEARAFAQEGASAAK